MTCALCGSASVIEIECHGPTGVVSPDGAAEYWTQYGLKCFDCGAVEEE
jgi:hypothetical protein